jgi:hypothetical protein
MKHLNKFEKFSPKVNENYEEIQEISLEEESIEDFENEVADELAEDEAEEMVAELEDEEGCGSCGECEECAYEEGAEDPYAYEGLTKFDDFVVVNEEEGVLRKTFTGVSDDEEGAEFKSKMMAKLEEYRANDKVHVPANIEKQMADNDYIGTFKLSKVFNTRGRLKHLNGKQVLSYEKGMSPAKRGVRGAFGLSTDKDSTGYSAGQSSMMAR